jgi:hypothetical protein
MNQKGVHFCTPDDALVVRNILIFLYTNSISVCEILLRYVPSSAITNSFMKCAEMYIRSVNCIFCDN